MNGRETNHAVEYWLKFFSGELPFESVVIDFLCKRQCLQALINSDVPSTQQLAIAQKLLDELLTIPLESLPSLLAQVGCFEAVSAASIPQFSNFASALVYLPKLLNESMKSMTHMEVGYALHQACTSDTAAKKYGENHAKLAIACGLAVGTKIEGFAGVRISLLGSAYCKFSAEEKLSILARLCYRIPIIQKAALSKDKNASVEESLLALSPSTRNRRRRNVYELLAYALNE